MPYWRFTSFNVIGAAGWVVSMLLVGYFVGEAVPNLDVFFFVIIGGVIALSLLPAAWHLWRERSAARREGSSAND